MKEVVLDTETTGISIKDGHRIVEIGCIELDNLTPTKKNFLTHSSCSGYYSSTSETLTSLRSCIDR